jgi:hypothetical protein
MNGTNKKFCQNGWSYPEDPGLDLYCNLEGMDRCQMDRHLYERPARPSIRPRLKIAVNRGAGLAAAWMVLIRFFRP